MLTGASKQWLNEKTVSEFANIYKLYKLYTRLGKLLLRNVMILKIKKFKGGGIKDIRNTFLIKTRKRT